MNDLTYQDVLSILRLIDTTGFSELEVEYEGTRVRVTRRIDAPLAVLGHADNGRAHAPAPGQHESSTPRHKGEPSPAGPAALAPVPSVDELRPDQMAVKPPMQGTFYASASPGQPPFATVGQRVRAGDQLGIVEVMKLFTPVAAPCDGTILKILVSNEQLVAEDQVLMILETE